MLDLQNISAIAMFKFFGRPFALVEDFFQEKNIKTIGDLRKARIEKAYFFDYITRDICNDVLLKTIFYGFYEIKTQNNKVGGVSVILFSVLVIVFANVIVLLR